MNFGNMRRLVHAADSPDWTGCTNEEISGHTTWSAFSSRRTTAALHISRNFVLYHKKFLRNRLEKIEVKRLQNTIKSLDIRGKSYLNAFRTFFSAFGIPFPGQAYARRRNPDLVVIFARFFCDTNFTSSIAVRDAVDLRYRYHQYNALRKLTSGAVDHGAVARELAENTVAAGEQQEEVLEEVAKKGREMALSDERVDQDEVRRMHTSLVSNTTGLIRVRSGGCKHFPRFQDD
ncbi:hypothetical protein LTR66_002572 [Elasticomyces elasticus]|nr:hypothetical protein LTR66_002572 [Elasticomyces elasticus]